MNWSIIREPTVIVTAIVYGVLSAIASLAGPFGIPLAFLLFCSIWRYCYSLLRAIAQGRKQVPAPDIDSFNPVGDWGAFLHLVSFPGLVLATALWFPPASVPVAVLVPIIFPASAALMGLTSSLVQAFNPAALSHFIRTVGSDYAALVIGYIAIFVGASLIVAFVVPVFGFLAMLLSLIVEYWALLASFALIGSVLRAHRLEFDIPGEIKPREEQELLRRHKDWQRDLDNAYVSFRSGITSAGYKTLHDLVAANNDSIEVNYWLVENMLDWEQKRFAFEVVEKLMPRLLAAGHGADALKLYQRCRWRDPEFRLPAAQSRQLAAHAAAFGQTGLAGELGYTPEDLQTR